MLYKHLFNYLLFYCISFFLLIHRGLSIAETHVKPGVQEHAAFLIFKINRNRDEFEKHKTRLATVRQENAARDLRMQESLGADYDYTTGREISDLLSETSSIAGSVSSRSSRSSRSSSG